MAAIPTLETERLVLRAFRADDFEAHASMAADPLVARYLGDGRTLDREEAWRTFAMLLGHWELRGYGLWALTRRGDDRMIGRVGFFFPEGWPGFEIGWTLSRDSWGKGYATEGARRALHHAFTEMGRGHVISLIHPDNAPSIRDAQRLGEKLEGKAEIFGMTVQVYGIDRENFR